MNLLNVNGRLRGRKWWKTIPRSGFLRPEDGSGLFYPTKHVKLKDLSLKDTNLKKKITILSIYAAYGTLDLIGFKFRFEHLKPYYNYIHVNITSTVFSSSANFALSFSMSCRSFFCLVLTLLYFSFCHNIQNIWENKASASEAGKRSHLIDHIWIKPSVIYLTVETVDGPV